MPRTRQTPEPSGSQSESAENQPHEQMSGAGDTSPEDPTTLEGNGEPSTNDPQPPELSPQRTAVASSEQEGGKGGSGDVRGNEDELNSQVENVKLIQQMLGEQQEIIAALQKERLACQLARAELEREKQEVKQMATQVERRLSQTRSVPSNNETSSLPQTPKLNISKCPKYNGETEWGAFLVQFQAWLRLNHLNNNDCQHTWSDLLGLALEGEARLFYGGLSAEDRGNYSTLVMRLEQRYCGEGAIELFKARLQAVPKRQPGEDISKLRDTLWLWSRRGYPGLPREAQEQLAMDALYRAVEHELRVQCTMKDCKTLDEAVAVMQRYEAVLQADPDRRRKMVKLIDSSSSNSGETSSVNNSCTKQLEELCNKMGQLLQQQKNFQQRGSRESRGSGWRGQGTRFKMWEEMNVTAVVKRVTLPGSVNSRLVLLLGIQLVMREMPAPRLHSRPAVGGESFGAWKRGKS